MTHSSNLFQDIKSRLSMSDIVQRYIGQLNRHNVICCPFHKEKTPSLKIYENSFYCFGCGAGGDIINFMARLFSLSNHEAAEKIDGDFGLGLTDAEYDPVSELKYEREKKKKKKAEDWQKKTLNKLCDIRYQWWLIELNSSGEENAKAVANVQYLDYLIDNSGFTIADKKEVDAVARRFSSELDRRNDIESGDST